MSRRLSMSRMHAAFACGYAFRHDVETHERPAGKEARIGSIVHGLVDAHINQTYVSHADVNPYELAVALSIFHGPLRTWLDARTWTACEIGFRYDAESGIATKGPRRGESGYDDHGEMVLKGTLDLVAISDGALWIADLKTGKAANAHPEQLYAQAVAASRHYGIERAFVGFVFARKTKCEEPKWEPLDADRLDAEAGRIRRVLRTIPTSRPVINEGCVFCPAREGCPAHQRPPVGADTFVSATF